MTEPELRVQKVLIWAARHLVISLRAADRFAVVSSARMDAFAANDAKPMERLRKMVTKNIGVLFYGLPQSDDRGSVLYRDILGPLDLDRASEDF